MVLAYLCPEHGYHKECDVSESGERICIEGADTAVTGITGSTRKSPPGETIMGNIKWLVTGRYGSKGRVIVEAFDFDEAIERAIEQVDDDFHISEVKPYYREDRRRL